jgi:hypothetical protein
MSGSPITSSSTLLQALQERAQAKLHSTYEIVKTQVDIAKQATSDRVETARAGKRLLDEGGEPIVQLLLARKASIDAAEMDKSIAEQLQVNIAALDESVSRLKAVQSLEESQRYGFSQLADDHRARCASLRQIADMLDTRAPYAEMNAAQEDALTLVSARTACSNLLERTAEGFESIKRKTVTNVRANDDTDNPSVNPNTFENLQDKTYSGLLAARQAASDRFEIAKGGKRLLDEAGDSVALVVMAKKASMDAASLDKDLAQKVQLATSLFERSSSLLMKAQFEQSIECTIGQADVADLGKEHEERAELYRQIANRLQVPIDSSELALDEWDALFLVRIREGTNTLKDNAFERLESIKAMALAGCA